MGPSLVAAARVAHGANHVGAPAELGCARLDPANAVVDVLERRGIGRRRRLPPVERGHDHAALGQRLVDHLVAVTVRATPGAAVELDHDREGPRALRPVDGRKIRRVSVTEVLDVLDLHLVAHAGLPNQARLYWHPPPVEYPARPAEAKPVLARSARLISFENHPRLRRARDTW